MAALLGATVSIALAAAPAFAAAGGKGNGNNGNGGFGGSSSSNNGGGGGGNTGGPRACALSDISPGASACSGFISSNLLNNSKIAEQQSALTQIGFAWDGNFNAITKIESLNGATLVNFGSALFGDTFVGFHFGNGAGLGDQATGFYRFDAGQTGITSFDLNILQGSSGAILYKTGIFNGGGGGGTGNVPEPSTWMTLIAGFTMLGLTARRRRNKLVAA